MKDNLEKFYELKEITKELKKYGYKFNNCLSEKKINSFERKFKVKLPEDYKNYLTVIANGGAGPAKRSHLYYFPSNFSYIYPLQKTESLRQNHHWNYDKRTSFRKFRKRFPYFEDNTNNQTIGNNLFSRTAKKDNIYQGSLILSHQGCGTYLIMEVTGEKPGRIWFDGDIGISVVCNSFYDWFNNWAIETLQIEEIKQEIYKPNLPITDPKAYINIGNAYSEKGLLDKAIELFKKSISMDFKNIDAYYYLGEAYLDSEMFDEAVEQYRKAIVIDPKKIISYFALGNAYLNNDFFEEAIEQYMKAIEIDNKFLNAYINLGITYKYKGMLDKAIEIFKKAISISPNYAVNAYKNLGNVYKDKELYNEAIEMYKKTILINRNNSTFFYELENNYLNEGLYDKAIEYFNNEIAKNVDFIEAYYYNLGIAYKHKGMYDQEIEMYKKVISISPEYADNAYYSLAEAYKNKGRFDEAIEMYKKVITITPYDAYKYYIWDKGYLKK